MWPKLKYKLVKLATIVIGGAYVSSPVMALRAWRDAGQPVPEYPGSVALVAHAFYPELVPELLACHATLPSGSAILLTTQPDTVDSVKNLVTHVGDAKVVGVENRGRDILPFLKLLNDGELDRYDIVLKLHTKRSPHLRDGNIRRKLLFTMLAGTRRRTAQVLALLADRRTGIVGWRAVWRSSPSYWMRNQTNVANLLRRMGMPPARRPAFFEGTMFWIRPAALVPLKTLCLTADDFPLEAGQTDAELHHALERIFSCAAAAAGFETRALSGRVLLESA